MSIQVLIKAFLHWRSLARTVDPDFVDLMETIVGGCEYYVWLGGGVGLREHWFPTVPSSQQSNPYSPNTAHVLLLRIM